MFDRKYVVISTKWFLEHWRSLPLRSLNSTRQARSINPLDRSRRRYFFVIVRLFWLVEWFRNDASFCWADGAISSRKHACREQPDWLWLSQNSSATSHLFIQTRRCNRLRRFMVTSNGKFWKLLKLGSKFYFSSWVTRAIRPRSPSNTIKRAACQNCLDPM